MASAHTSHTVSNALAINRHHTSPKQIIQSAQRSHVLHKFSSSVTKRKCSCLSGFPDNQFQCIERLHNTDLLGYVMRLASTRSWSYAFDVFVCMYVFTLRIVWKPHHHCNSLDIFLGMHELYSYTHMTSKSYHFWYGFHAYIIGYFKGRGRQL